jgi:DNA-binding response OmpR family regulator
VKALVVDDDRVLADLVAFTLRREGFEVLLAYDGASGLRRWEEARPDIVILDVNLPHTVPKMDGFTVLRHIREQADTPVILLTVREDEEDIVRGLKSGADDYVLKPFSPRQLVARIQAVLRRAGRAAVPALRQFGDLVFDPGRREVRVGSRKPVMLTPLESRMLDYLMLHAGHYVTVEDLIEHIWGAEKGNREMLRQLVRRLRSKIEPDTSQPTYIENLPGLGYGLMQRSS